MDRYSTRQAAKKLGIAHNTLAQYIAVGKVPAPEAVIPGIRPTHVWTADEIEHVRKLLPKIANGRKTRYQKLRAAQKKEAQKQRTQAKKPVPGKRKTKNTKSKTPQA
jgi:predicted site-specific integrase-resolvase